MPAHPALVTAATIVALTVPRRNIIAILRRSGLEVA